MYSSSVHHAVTTLLASPAAAPPSGNTGTVTWPWLLGLLVLLVVLILGVIKWMMRSK